MASRSHPKLIPYRTGGIAQQWHTAMFPPSTTSHANYSSICSPSLLLSCLLSSLLSSSPPPHPQPSTPPQPLAPRQNSSTSCLQSAEGRGSLAAAFNLSLISPHCNGKRFCLLTVWLKRRSHPSLRLHSLTVVPRVSEEWEVFFFSFFSNFTPHTKNVFYQKNSYQ